MRMTNRYTNATMETFGNMIYWIAFTVSFLVAKWKIGYMSFIDNGKVSASVYWPENFKYDKED